MLEAIYVLYVPKAKRGQVRNRLAAEADAGLKWRERRTFFGSEFYFSGPAAKAREVHASATGWIKDSRF